MGLFPLGLASASPLSLPGTIPPVKPYRIYSVPTYQTTVAAGGSLTLATLTGAGAVLGVELAVTDTAGGNNDKDCNLQFLVDGSSSPSVSAAVGTMGAWFVGTATARACTHMQIQVESASQSSVTMRYPVPFSSGCKVVLSAAGTTDSCDVYAYVWWTPDLISDLRINQQAVASAVLTSTETYTWMTRPAGSAGWIVAHALVCNGATDYTYLRRSVAAYIDQEASPSYVSGATDDFFTSSWLAAAQNQQDSPWHYVTVSTNDYWNAFADLLAKHGGIRYTNGVSFEWYVDPDNPLQPDTGVTMNYLTWYYE